MKLRKFWKLLKAILYAISALVAVAAFGTLAVWSKGLFLLLFIFGALVGIIYERMED